MDIDLSSDDALASDLLQKFSRLNTNDRDSLLQQFKHFTGNQCNDSIAEFWLDMNNWNLQAAICSYYDYESSGNNVMIKLPSVQIDITENINDYLPNTSFNFNCTVTNSGDEQLPNGCSLRFCGGEAMSKTDRWLIPQINPGESWQVSLKLTSPNKPGIYFSRWRLSTLTGQFFGETIYIIVNVLDDLSQVTNQLSAAHIVDHLRQQHMQSTETAIFDSTTPPPPPPQSPFSSFNTTVNHSTLPAQFIVANGNISTQNHQNVLKTDLSISNNHNHNNLQQQQQNNSNNEQFTNLVNKNDDNSGTSGGSDSFFDDNSMTI